MVRLLLSIKAELENVTNLVPAHDDFEFVFQVKCTHCNETHPKLVSMNRLEKREQSFGKGSKAHFVWRCGLCKRESSATFEPPAPQPYNAENENFGPLVVLECRGLEFIGFDPQGYWKCEGLSGKPFEFNLEDGEWVDYDEKAALPVGVSNIESKWTRA